MVSSSRFREIVTKILVRHLPSGHVQFVPTCVQRGSSVVVEVVVVVVVVMVVVVVV